MLYFCGCLSCCCRLLLSFVVAACVIVFDICCCYCCCRCCLLLLFVVVAVVAVVVAVAIVIDENKISVPSSKFCFPKKLSPRAPYQVTVVHTGVYHGQLDPSLVALLF